MEIGASVTFTRMVAAMKEKIKTLDQSVFNSLSVTVNHLRRLATTQVRKKKEKKKKKKYVESIFQVRNMGSISGNLEITKALRVFPSDWVLQLLTFNAWVQTNTKLMV